MKHKVGDKIRCKVDWANGPKEGNVLTIVEIQHSECQSMDFALFIGHRSWYGLDGRRFGLPLILPRSAS